MGPEDASEKRLAIGIFEVRVPPCGPALLVLAPLRTLLGYLLLTPFITPRSWSRVLLGRAVEGRRTREDTHMERET
jgi:hypothetical protein